MTEKLLRSALLSLCLTGALALPALAEGGDFNDQQQQAQDRAAQAERDLGSTDYGPGGQIIQFPAKPPPVVTTRAYVPVYDPVHGPGYARVRVPVNVPVMSETEIRGGLRKQGFSNIHDWRFDDRRAIYHVRAYDNKGQAVSVAVRATDGYILEVLPYWY